MEANLTNQGAAKEFLRLHKSYELHKRIANLIKSPPIHSIRVIVRP
jgi:hypothetical protein